MSKRIGAIDQGTTSTRLIVFDDGASHTLPRRSHRTVHPRPGWVEQDPSELLGNIRDAITEAGRLDAIGLANQGESCLAWDGLTGEPLSPVIVWQDSRTAAELAALPPEATALVAARAGLPLDPYFSAAKLGWIVRNVPAAAEARRSGRLRLGTTDAFFLDRLAGTFATDRATASRTSLMNLGTGEWDPDLCDLFGVPMEALPTIRANTAGFGSIDGVPVTAAIVDQQAALYGHGCRRPGDSKITFGTGAFALAVTGSTPVAAADARGLLPTVAWDLGAGPTYALDGGVYDVGSAIDWAIRTGLARSVADFAAFDAPPAIARGLVFVPAFSGLAAPHWDRTAAPLLIGMTPDTTRGDLCQALLEGIALQTAELVRALEQATSRAPTLSIDGGVSQSPYFTRVLASVLDREIEVSRTPELTARGVAELAGAVLPPNPTDRVAPGLDLGDGAAERFDDAVSRARGWRR